MNLILLVGSLAAKKSPLPSARVFRLEYRHEQHRLCAGYRDAFQPHE